MGILLACAAVMIGGMFYTWSMNRNAANAATDHATRVAMRIAGNPVEDGLLTEAIGQQAKQSIARGGDPATSEIEATKIALNGLLGEASQAGLVKKLGIKTDEAALLPALKAKTEDDIQTARFRLMSQGQLKFDAKDADFEKVLGRPLSQVRADAEKQDKEMISTPEGRQRAVMLVAPSLLKAHYTSQVKATDADIKASYNQYQFKRILFQPPLAGKPSVEDRIKAAQAELAKNTPFEQVIDKYSDEHPVTGKKARDTTVPMLQSEMSGNPQLTPLLALKPGQVSDVITTPEGKAIYKLLSTKSNLPSDYEKSKERYRQQFVTTAADSKMNAELEAYKKTPGLIEFKSPGYKAFYDVMQAIDNATDPSGKSQIDRVRAAYDEAVQAQNKSEGFNPHPAVLARYAASNFLWGFPGSDKTKHRPERIDTLQAVLQDSESFQARKDLFDLYLEDKKYDDAGAQLLEAAKNNTSYDQAGFARFNQIRDMLASLQKVNGAKPDLVKAIQAAQLDWSRARTENDKILAEQKLEQAKAEAEQKALFAKEKAELEKKDKENAAKAKAGAVKAPAGAPTTGSITPGQLTTGTTAATAGATATLPPPTKGAPKK